MCPIPKGALVGKLHLKLSQIDREKVKSGFKRCTHTWVIGDKEKFCFEWEARNWGEHT